MFDLTKSKEKSISKKVMKKNYQLLLRRSEMVKF